MVQRISLHAVAHMFIYEVSELFQPTVFQGLVTGEDIMTESSTNRWSFPTPQDGIFQAISGKEFEKRCFGLDA